MFQPKPGTLSHPKPKSGTSEFKGRSIEDRLAAYQEPASAQPKSVEPERLTSGGVVFWAFVVFVASSFAGLVSALLVVLVLPYWIDLGTFITTATGIGIFAFGVTTWALTRIWVPEPQRTRAVGVCLACLAAAIVAGFVLGG